MATQEIVKKPAQPELVNSASDIERVLIQGDISRLSPEQKINYYTELCRSLRLNPLTKPFDYLTLQGKTILYAKKDATDQLRAIHGVSVFDVVHHSDAENGIYVVTAKGRDKMGREDTGTGAVNVAGLKGNDLANAIMKAETKAKRRLTLSICGLGMLDETELETIKDARPQVVQVVSQSMDEYRLEEWKEKIAKAANLEELTRHYKDGYKEAFAMNDRAAMDAIIAAKDDRKKGLSHVD